MLFSREMLERWPCTLGLIGLLIAELMPCGCGQAPGPTLPPATVIVPEAPSPRPSMEASPSPALVPPTAKAVHTPQPQATPPETVMDVTILHTNDVMGEVDPCG